MVPAAVARVSCRHGFGPLPAKKEDPSGSSPHPLSKDIIYSSAEYLHRIGKRLLVKIESPVMARRRFLCEDPHKGGLTALLLYPAHHVGNVLAATVAAAGGLRNRKMQLLLAYPSYPGP